MKEHYQTSRRVITTERKYDFKTDTEYPYKVTVEDWWDGYDINGQYYVARHTTNNYTVYKIKSNKFHVQINDFPKLLEVTAQGLLNLLNLGFNEYDKHKWVE